MPQFVFRATDRMGNTVEGAIAADSQADALSQVRGMGYTPLHVQPKGPGTTPSALPDPNLTMTPPLAVAPVTATQPLHNVPSIAVTQPIPPPARPRRIDLSAPMEEIAGSAGALYGLSGAEAGAEGASGGHLEPWERTIGLNDPAHAEQTTDMATNGVQPTQALPAGGPQPFTAPQTGRSLTGSRPEFRQEPVKPFPQLFLERVIYPIFSGVVLKDLAPFYRQFATLINAGIPLYQALSALESSTKNPKLKEIARAGQKQVQGGGRFSDVMEAYPWICSPMQIEIVRAAEQGGMLDTSLRQVADYVDSDLAIRRLISRETIYPKIVLFVALMLLGRPGFMFGTMAIVRFVLGGMGKDAYTGVDYLKDTLGFGFLCLFPIAAGIIFFRLSLFNSVSFREGYDSVKTSIPVLGNLVRMFATAKFCRTFAALYRGGFPIGSALQVAGNASGNFVLRRAAYRAAAAADRGEMVGDSMRSSGFFNPMTVDMFRTGETSGSLDLMVEKIAEYYESEGQMKAHQAAMILGVTVFLLVTILVAIQVISQYGGLATSEMKAGEGFLHP
jgi:type II secretory pathway component PulF